MGQRLVVSIKANDKLLANAYYHWSGYTGSSIGCTEIIIETIKSMDKVEPDVRTAVYLLRSTGADLIETEKDKVSEELKDLYQNLKPANRNDGIISITKEQMSEYQSYSEGDVIIDIGTNDIYFGVYWVDMLDKDHMIKKHDLFPVTSVPYINHADIPYHTTIDTFYKFVELYMNNPDGCFGITSDNKGYIMGWIH